MRHKSADLAHRNIIRHNMESYDTAHLKGRVVSRLGSGAAQVQEIKREAVNHLDNTFSSLKRRSSRMVVMCSGGRRAEACAYIADLAARKQR